MADVFDKSTQTLERLRSAGDLAFSASGDAVFATIAPAAAKKDLGALTRIWRFPLSGAPEPVTEGPGSDAHPTPAPDGSALAFVSDRTVKGKAAPFIAEGTQAPREYEGIPGTVEAMAWTGDSAHLVALAADRGLNGGATNGATRLSWGEPEDPQVTAPGQALRRLYTIERASGAVREVGPDALTVWEFALCGDTGAVAVVSPDASERGWHHPRLVHIDFATRAVRPLHTPEWQIQGLAVDPSARRVALLEGWSSDRGLVAGDITIIEIATGASSTIPCGNANFTAVSWRDADSLWFAGWERLGSMYGVIGIDGTVVWREHEDATIGESGFVAAIVPAPDGQGFAAVREAIGEPSEIVFKSSREAPWHTLSALNTEVAAAYPDDPEIRALTWTGPDGLTLEGLVVLPRRTGGSLPTIVDIHGGPCYAAKFGFNPSNALPLVAAGYAVFLPNYRGNVGWGQAFTRRNLGDPAGAEFEDILAGIDALVAQGIADPERLGVTGISYGGYMTAWAVATTDRFKAAIMQSGIANQISCHYACEHDFHAFINGGPLTDPKAYAIALDRSPITRLKRPTTPTLILHGGDDRCTPLGQAQEFYWALQERGVESELVVYPREGHGITEDAHRADAIARKRAWFDSHLRPDA